MNRKNNLRKEKIGLALSSIPGYSETFFRNKIKGLESHGFEVVLFVDYMTTHNFSNKIIVSDSFDNFSVKTIFNGAKSLLKCALVHPNSSYQHYSLDRHDGFTLVQSLRRLILNQYMLGHKLDWLHFGYGMLAVGKENVAESIGAQMAVSFRGFDLYLSPLKHPKCYDLLFRKKVKYHVLSNAMKKRLIDYQIEPNSIKVLPPAIDNKVFISSNHPKQSSILQITTVARLHWIKGLEYTLEALHLLKKLGLSFRYTVIGDGDQKERLIFTSHQLGIADCVDFVGQLTQKELKAHLDHTDIYLQYSIQEGFCNAVLEAQAMRLLCIVSDAEGLKENVIDQQTGWVVPKRKPEELSKKILEVSKLPITEKDRIRDAAADRVRNKFNLELQQMALVKFYQVF